MHPEHATATSFVGWGEKLRVHRLHINRCTLAIHKRALALSRTEHFLDIQLTVALISITCKVINWLASVGYGFGAWESF